MLTQGRLGGYLPTHREVLPVQKPSLAAALKLLRLVASVYPLVSPRAACLPALPNEPVALTNPEILH